MRRRNIIKATPEEEKKREKKEKKANRPNSRISPNIDICNLIVNIALESAIENETVSSSTIESITIDNSNSSLERFIPKGPSPEHISFLSSDPSLKGDIISLSKIRNIRIFIWWKGHYDLDTSFIGYAPNYEITNQLCAYNQLIGFRNTVRHSGDITNAPKGAAEYITFNIDELKSANVDVDHVLVITQSFRGDPFNEMDALVGIGYMPEDPNEIGDGPDGCVVLSACRLTGKATTNISGILHLSRDENVPDSFEFMTINSNNITRNFQSAGSCKKLLQNVVINYDIWRNSLNAPITQLEKEVIRAAAYNEVSYIDKDGSLHIFRKEEDESSIEFYTRLISIIIKK